MDGKFNVCNVMLNKKFLFEVFVVFVYFLLAGFVYYREVVAIKAYKKDFTVYLLEYKDLVEFDQEKSLKANQERVCGAEVLVEGYYSKRPRIKIPSGFKTLLVETDPARLEILDKKLRIPAQFILFTNSDVGLSMFDLSFEKPEHAQLHACAYKDKIPASDIMKSYSSRLLESQVYVAFFDSGTGQVSIKRLR